MLMSKFNVGHDLANLNTRNYTPNTTIVAVFSIFIARLLQLSAEVTRNFVSVSLMCIIM